MSAISPPLESLVETVGFTPLVELRRIGWPGARVYAKLEQWNPAGSIDDRMALAVAGTLAPGTIAHTQGSPSFAISLSHLAQTRRWTLTVVRPSRLLATEEQAQTLAAYGVDVVDRAPAESLELIAETAGAAPWRAIAAELEAQLGAQPDRIVAPRDACLSAFLLEESDWAPRFLQVDLVGAPGPDAWEMKERLARKEGLLVSPLSGAVAVTAATLASEYGEGRVIVAVFPETGERFLSTARAQA